MMPRLHDRRVGYISTSLIDYGRDGHRAEERRYIHRFRLEKKDPSAEVSEPVKSQFGWHVIQVMERRTKPVPSLEDMKEQLDQYLTRKAQQDAVLALRQSGKVERLDKPAEAAKPK